MSGANDIQIRELKDTILQLNNTVNTQNTLLVSLNKQLEEKDQLIANLNSRIEYFKTKLFGSTSEVCKKYSRSAGYFFL